MQRKIESNGLKDKCSIRKKDINCTNVLEAPKFNYLFCDFSYDYVKDLVKNDINFDMCCIMSG
jgi:hypothetical protein